MNESRIQFTQISLLNVLLVGRYGGIINVAEIKKIGNMAIGTMDRLDGEMLMIDGVVYQACADGHVCLPTEKETIPFGMVADFHTEQELCLNEILNYEQFEDRMKVVCPQTNSPLAIRFTGRFTHMKVRTVRRQEQDGIGLAEVAKDEALFDLYDTSGDLVGFYLPGYVQGINASGWHLHFMDSDRKSGGHVVNFSIHEGLLHLCHATDYHICLPASTANVLSELDPNRDWSREVTLAEAER